MDVYLVPASPSRHALYCEVDPGDDHPADAGLPPSGFSRLGAWFRRRALDPLKASFRRAVEEGEAQQDSGADDPGRGRLRKLITRKIAEAVAEQRLLWNLRHHDAARLVHPDTLDGARALEVARGEFAHDYSRHRRWLIIDGLLVLLTGPALFFVPGPNVVSWYFTFRAVGHFFAMRGAGRGLSVVAWTPVPSPHLTTVAEALPLDGDARESRLASAAAALGLDRLAAFVERIADDAA
jgi:hypothetical protein